MYQFKTKPFDHQLSTFNATRELPAYAILWEQGTGKSKLTIDTIAERYLAGEINAALIVASNGVHRNWVTDELPAHLPDAVAQQAFTLSWNTNAASTQTFKRKFDNLLGHKGLAIFTISYDAFITAKGKKAVWSFLSKRKVFYVLDEAHNIKTPGAKRTMSIVRSAVYAKYRRVLSGTPVPNSPFDIYAPLKFLDNKFWNDIGCADFASFKAFFGVWSTGFRYDPRKDKRVEYPVLEEYRNLPTLNKKLSSISSRVLKDEVLDLPPKLYSKRTFELTDKQKAAYKQLKEDGFILLNTDTVTVNLPMVLLLRFQQITCNYLPVDNLMDSSIKHVEIDTVNRRLDTLMDAVEATPHPGIIWARFTKDIDLICARLEAAGERYVRYDGTMTDEECERSKSLFQDEHADIKWFVGNPAKGSEGLTLVRAKTVIYYNNSFRLLHRLQSEDRAHRIGQNHPVFYVDIMAEDTVDEKIVQALRMKLDVASQITGDKLKEWI